MTTTDLVDRLAAHTTLGSAPRDELAWLAAHGTVRQLAVGDVLTPKGVTVEGLFIVLSGRIAIYVDRGAGLNKVMEWRDGEVTGLLPYSRLVAPPANTVAEEPTTVLAIHRDLMPDIIRECHQVTSILVHTMMDRSKVFTSSELHDKKMMALGNVSAGLAHELNNPASAIERSAALLDDRLDDSERATRALGATHLDAAQLAAVDALRQECLATPTAGVRSAIEQADREETIVDWLAQRHLDVLTAEALAETGVTIAALDRAADVVRGPELDVALRWVAAGCLVRTLASEIQEAAMRISGLVAAVKGFTHMDQAFVAEPVDLRLGLSNTVTVLKSKARKKSAAVVVEVEPDLPQVRGFAGELNQIWANLIDNALYVIPEGGRIEVLARREGSRVAVRIVDNGGGIPAAIRDRIFEPFFTTKDVGQGTGIGLDIVRRLVRHNDGEIAVESQPGRTEFRISLPIAQAASVGPHT